MTSLHPVTTSWSRRLASACSPRTFVSSMKGHRGALALVDQAVVSLTNFATSLIIARVCGKAELGLYLLAWTTITIVNEILTAVIATPYVVISPTLSDGERRRYCGSAVLHQFGLSAVAVLCSLIAGVRLHFGPRADLGRVLTVVSGLLAILVLKEFARRLWFAHLEMRAALIGDVGASTLQMLAVGALFLSHRLSTITCYSGIALAALLPTIMWSWMYRDRLYISTSASLSDFRTNWTLAKWIVGSGGLWAAAMYTYPWLLVWMHGPALTGVWAACFGFVALSNPVLLGFGNYLGPRIAQLCGFDGVFVMRRYVYRSALHFVCLLLPLAFIVWFWGDFFIGHLYGKAFVGHQHVIRVLACNVLISGLVFPFTRGFFALQRADLDLFVNVVAIAILFVFGIPLVRHYGVMGAAAGLTLTNGLTTLMRIALFARVTRGEKAYAFSLEATSAQKA